MYVLRLPLLNAMKLLIEICVQVVVADVASLRQKVKYNFGKFTPVVWTTLLVCSWTYQCLKSLQAQYRIGSLRYRFCKCIFLIEPKIAIFSQTTKRTHIENVLLYLFSVSYCTYCTRSGRHDNIYYCCFILSPVLDCIYCVTSSIEQ